jgi:16S rRNA (guanine(966)-N(2))-methyltransferase RsmD
MRIVSGTHKGRRINPPKNLPVRPTTDMAKEGLFNILNNYLYFDQLKVLDLFAGTGNISFEFASREAVSIMAIDINYRCVDYIRKVARELNFEKLSAQRADVFRYLRTAPAQAYDLIFADAPYDMDHVETIPGLIFEQSWLNKNAWLIIEHPRGIDFSRHSNFVHLRNYGKVYFSFFRQV